ncbi:conjugal transfer protein [Prevotella melaninogenica]|jgi:hypothetical protein
MDEDILLYISSIICVLLIIYQIFKHQKATAALSAIVLLGYSLPLYYFFFFRSEYGAGLTYWFYLLVFNLIYILSTAIHLIFKYIKGR